MGLFGLNRKSNKAHRIVEDKPSESSRITTSNSGLASFDEVPDCEDSQLLEQLRKSTVGAIHEKAVNETISAERLEELWNDPNCRSGKMLAELDDALKRSAGSGSTLLRVNLTGEVDRGDCPGLRLRKYHNTKTCVGLDVVNFQTCSSEENLVHASEKAFASQKQLEAFQLYVLNKICEHYGTQGLEVIYDPKRNSSHLDLQWISSREYGQFRRLMKIPGGYEAYMKGVPVEDIMA